MRATSPTSRLFEHLTRIGMDRAYKAAELAETEHPEFSVDVVLATTHEQDNVFAAAEPAVLPTVEFTIGYHSSYVAHPLSIDTEKTASVDLHQTGLSMQRAIGAAIGELKAEHDKAKEAAHA